MAKSKMYEKNMNKVDFNNLVLSYLIENALELIKWRVSTVTSAELCND